MSTKSLMGVFMGEQQFDASHALSRRRFLVLTGVALGTGGLLAATLVVLAISYGNAAQLHVSSYALAAGTIAAGLVVAQRHLFGRAALVREAT